MVYNNCRQWINFDATQNLLLFILMIVFVSTFTFILIYTIQLSLLSSSFLSSFVLPSPLLFPLLSSLTFCGPFLFVQHTFLQNQCIFLFDFYFLSSLLLYDINIFWFLILLSTYFLVIWDLFFYFSSTNF